MEENTGTWIFLAYRLEFPREDGGTEEKSPPLSLYRDFSSDQRAKPLPVSAQKRRPLPQLGPLLKCLIRPSECA